MFWLPSVKRRHFVTQRGMASRDDVVIHVAVFIANVTRRAHAGANEQVTCFNEPLARRSAGCPVLLVMGACPLFTGAMAAAAPDTFSQKRIGVRRQRSTNSIAGQLENRIGIL